MPFQLVYGYDSVRGWTVYGRFGIELYYNVYLHGHRLQLYVLYTTQYVLNI